MNSGTTQSEAPSQTVTLTLDQALEQAVAHHRAGRLQDAERLYRAILEARPQHPDANHNLGVLAMQARRPDAALPRFKAALDADPAQGQYWLSYIGTLAQAGQKDAARQVLDEGRRHGLQGEAVDALAMQLARSAPSIAPAVSTGGKKKSKTRAAKPEKAAGRAASRPGAGPDPQQIDTLRALFNAGRYADAASVAQTMTTRFPQHGFGWKALGAALQQMGRSADALAPMRKAAALLPGDTDVHVNLGLALHALGRLDEADASLERALRIDPDMAEAHSYLGNVRRDRGRLEDAEASYRRAIAIDSNFAEAHGNLGNALRALGRLDEAEASYRRALAIKPDYAGAHSNLGNVLRDRGRLDEAEACYRHALRLAPDFAAALYNLGNILKDRGRLDEAEASFRRALQLKPAHAEAHSNLGNVLHDLGRLDEAEASYRRALAIRPDFAAAHYNLGVTLHDLGRLDEAEACCRQALAIEPHFADAHYNLAVVLRDLGRLDEAEASYRRALDSKPDYAEALNGLALLFNARGQSAPALSAVRQSLRISETADAKRIFVACVKHLDHVPDDGELQLAIVRALTEPWERPATLVPVAIQSIKRDPDIAAWIARADAARPAQALAKAWSASGERAAIAATPLLLALLDSAPVCDTGMERLLTLARHAMLEAAVATTAADTDVGAASHFDCALARQCFINEYVFSHGDDEIRKAGELRDALAAALAAGAPVPALWPIAVAAYYPLHSLPLADRLLERHWPDDVAAVLVQQIREPAEERALRAAIPSLTDIDDDVSRRVRSQYEENPYPRWVKAEPAAKATTVVGYLSRRFPLASFDRRGGSAGIDILIAGCGTGQHSIGTARQFPEARVLAVDLSLSSLAYALRKTRELGVTSIEYAQADLLKLGALGRRFDVVESVGVLHHLADPFAGWQVLLSLLRPGGFMKLGFYSEAARRHIVKARAFIAERGYGTTADEIRRCRRDLVASDGSADFGRLPASPDFFSLSDCRDLLFHVQEHRMTLTGIDAFLREHGLTFLGFEIDADVLNAYKSRFPEDRAATDLGRWQMFENEHPDTFIGMYQFWIQKAS